MDMVVENMPILDEAKSTVEIVVHISENLEDMQRSLGGQMGLLSETLDVSFFLFQATLRIRFTGGKPSHQQSTSSQHERMMDCPGFRHLQFSRVVIKKCSLE